MLEVILHKGGDKVVGMIVARLHSHVEGDARHGASVHEVSGKELTLGQKSVVGALIAQNAVLYGYFLLLQKFRGVVLLPRFFIRSQIPGKGSLTPGTVNGIADGSEGGNALEHAGILQ